jgi:predicted enzyme related to lactoylglutathione lyase
MNMNGILIGSEDPERLAAYYTGLFGEPGWHGGEFHGWQLGTGWMTVGPHDQVQGRNAHPGRLIWNLETPDVRGEFERLKAAGATVVQEPYQPGEAPDGWIATFSDPDDNYFQLVSPM